MNLLARVLMLPAVLVLAPRLASLFAVADGAAFNPSTLARFDLLAATGTAVTLTLGQAMIAHRAAVTERRRGLLVVLWCIAVGSTCYLGAVAVAVRTSGVDLVNLLAGKGSEPGSSAATYLVFGFVATLAVEVVVAASAVVQADGTRVDEKLRELEDLREELNSCGLKLLQAETRGSELGVELAAVRDELGRSNQEVDRLFDLVQNVGASEVGPEVDPGTGRVEPSRPPQVETGSTSVPFEVAPYSEPCPVGCGKVFKHAQERYAKTAATLHGKTCPGQG